MKFEEFLREKQNIVRITLELDLVKDLIYQAELWHTSQIEPIKKVWWKYNNLTAKKNETIVYLQSPRELDLWYAIQQVAEGENEQSKERG